MIHMIQINSLLVWIYLYAYIWSGFGLIAVYTIATRHNILVWSIDLTQHLFGIDSIQLMIQSGFSKKWIDSSSDSSGYEKCDSIQFMIQAKITQVRKQQAIDALREAISAWHDPSYDVIGHVS